MSTYYVATSGSDSNNGTSPSMPWRSITHVNAQIVTGDTVEFAGGETFSGTLISTGANQSFTSYGTGRATIDGGMGEGMVVYNTSGTNIANITFRGSTQASVADGSSALTSSLSAGATAVWLDKTTGLAAGDRVLIDADNRHQVEEDTVAASYAGGNMVPLVNPIVNSHIVAIDSGQLASSVSAGSYQIQLTFVQGLQPGETINIDSGSAAESATVVSWYTPGTTLITFTNGLSRSHTQSAVVSWNAGPIVTWTSRASTLTSSVLSGATTINLASVSGLTIGQSLEIDRYGSSATNNTATNFELAYVKSIAGNTLTLESPLILAHSAGVGVYWDSDDGITLLVNNGAAYSQGISISNVDVSGFGGVGSSEAF